MRYVCYFACSTCIQCTRLKLFNIVCVVYSPKVQVSKKGEGWLCKRYNPILGSYCACGVIMSFISSGVVERVIMLSPRLYCLTSMNLPIISCMPINTSLLLMTISKTLSHEYIINSKWYILTVINLFQTRKSLPIYAYREQLLDAIREHQVWYLYC